MLRLHKHKDGALREPMAISQAAIEKADLGKLLVMILERIDRLEAGLERLRMAVHGD